MKQRKNRTLREQIVSSLRESIIRGELTPGQKVSEPELAGKLGISRTPIREAFRQLESEGFLTVMPRRGAAVSAMSKKEIEDFYEVKSLLEGYAAKKAAPRINDKDIQRLRKLNDQLGILAQKGDVESFFRKNREFHYGFISLCGNRRIPEIWNNLTGLFIRYRMESLAAPGRLAVSVRGHDEIVNALEQGDGELAESLVFKHCRETSCG